MAQRSLHLLGMKSKEMSAEIAEALRRLRDEEPEVYAALVILLRRLASR